MVALTSKLEQDRAAGGENMRKLRIRSGDIVIVSLSISGKMLKPISSVTMRFKTGGHTVTRPVGKINGASRRELLKNGWAKVKHEKIAEQNGWSWLNS